jgi:hypothetical protein
MERVGERGAGGGSEQVEVEWGVDACVGRGAGGGVLRRGRWRILPSIELRVALLFNRTISLLLCFRPHDYANMT